MAHLGHGERHRLIGAEGIRPGLSGIALHAAGQIQRNAQPRRSVGHAGQGRHRRAQLPVKAEAVQSVHNHIGLLHGAAADLGILLPVQHVHQRPHGAVRVFGQVRRGKALGQDHRHPRPHPAEQPGADKAVAAVIPLPAQDGDFLSLRRSFFADMPHRRRTGLLHQLLHGGAPAHGRPLHLLHLLFGIKPNHVSHSPLPQALFP